MIAETQVSIEFAAIPVGVSEIAELAGVKPDTVKKWRHRGIFPQPAHTLRMGPVWWRQDVETWIEHRKIKI